MFDVNADDGSVRKKRYRSPIPDTKYIDRPVRGNTLDNASFTRQHTRFLGIYQRELERQAENRMEMATDEAFYDNEQWDESDAQTLRERGQMPLVFNVVASTCDWVIGTEKRSRTDFKILPRRKQDGKPAEKKTELMKYLSDANRTPFTVSRGFEDTVKAGLGWIEDGYQGEGEAESIYSRYENWRNMLWDSTSIEPDLADARYVIRSKWLDLDIAISMFPKRAAVLKRAASSGINFSSMDSYGDYPMDGPEAENTGHGFFSGQQRDQLDYERQRVRVIEMWIRTPVLTPKMSGGLFNGEIFDPLSEGHAEAVHNGDAQVVEKVAMRMHVAIFCTAGMLWFSQSPYRHNQFPFTPIWGKRRAKDNLPYGLIRNIRDLQSDINKRASKALHILSSNKIIMDEGAVDDVDELAEEAGRPDAIIVKKQGYQLELNADRDLSQWHLELMSRNIQMVQQVGGVTDELMGRRTNAVSGVAIEARQNQGALSTAKFFDNLRFAQQVRGEKLLSMMEQFVSELKEFRITNKRGGPEYVKVNDGLPENDIIRSKADFIISEDDWRASIRQGQVESLMELLGKMAGVAPQVTIVMLDLIIESMDIPQRDELVKRIRKVTGMSDPDAEEPSPEELAAAQSQNAQMQLASAMAEANLEKIKAEAARLQAQAEELAARATKLKVDSQGSALLAAGAASVMPANADVADHILHESGFVSRTELEGVIKNAQAQQQQAAIAADEAAAQQQQEGIPMGIGMPQQGDASNQIGIA